MQVLLDDEPGLLGSIVDVEITGHARWCTFGTVCDWVFRCPPPADPAPEAATAGRLRARARVAAARQQAKATPLPPPAVAAAAATDAAPGRDVGMGFRGERDGGAGDAGVTHCDVPGSGWGQVGEAVLTGGRRRVTCVLDWFAARQSGAASVAEHDGKSGRMRADVARWMSFEDAMLVGGVVVGACGLATAAVLARKGGQR